MQFSTKENRWFLGAVAGILMSLIPAQSAEPKEVGKPVITIDCNHVEKALKPQIAGVALGGGGNAFVNSTFLKRIPDMGIRFVRLEAITGDSRGSYDAERGMQNWDRLDKEIENIRATGADIIANVFYLPRALSLQPEDPHYFYAKPKDYDAWARYVETIVCHVNREKNYGIRYWEIGNEPSGKYFFRGNMAEFFHYYEVTARAIKKADPTALVGGFGDNADYPSNYKTFFESVNAANTPLDFISYHFYGQWRRDDISDPTLPISLGSKLGELGQEILGRQLPLMITEWNLVGERPDRIPARVPAYVGAVYTLLQKSPIQAACIFRIQPYGKTGGSLLNKEGDWQSPGRIFRFHSQLPATAVAIPKLPPSYYGYASTEKNRTGVLLARYDASNSETLDTRVVLNNGIIGKCRIRLFIEDESSVETPGESTPCVEREIKSTPDTPVEIFLRMAPYSVAYIEVTQIP